MEREIELQAYLYLVKFQAEGSELSAELEFLDQQNIILSMENRALRQRLDSLSQEQLIKHCMRLLLLFFLFMLQLCILLNCLIAKPKLMFE